MSDNPWEAAKHQSDKFTESFLNAAPEKQSALALAEIARQLILLNANLDILSSVAENGLNRIADSP